MPFSLIRLVNIDLYITELVMQMKDKMLHRCYRKYR